MNYLDDSFVALAHPARRAIVARLAHGPATVAEAAAGLEMSKPAVSKHVRLLEDAGVVTRRVSGRTHELRLQAETLSAAADWIVRHTALWERYFDAVQAQLDKEDPK